MSPNRDDISSHLTFAKEDELAFPLEIAGAFPANEKDLQSLLNKARKEVADEFIRRKNGKFFNGKLYGISCIDGYGRTNDIKENPVLTCELYDTDYYTHCVIEHVLRELCFYASTPKNELVDELNKYLQAFRTSLGISVIVIIPKSNKIILTKRTVHAAYSEQKNWIYVSATETFSQADEDTYSGIPTVSNCVKRGIEEELGITAGQCDFDTLKIYDAFYEVYFCQDNIVASIELRPDIGIEDLDFTKGRDYSLEVADVFAIDNTKEAVNDFIKKNHEGMRDQTIFSLQSYIERL